MKEGFSDFGNLLTEYEHVGDFQHCYILTIIVACIVELSPQYYDSDEISKEGFSDFGNVLTEHEHAGDFLVDELMEIVHDGDR